MRTLLPIDTEVADLLREQGEQSVSSLANHLGVTGTAVRQRLSRLTEAGWVTRKAVGGGRGRPSHRYSLTGQGRQQSGSNFVDLAFALWEEIRLIPDVSVRRGLLQRIAGRMAATYEVAGKSTKEKMEVVAKLFGDRKIPISVGSNGELPVLTARSCPYPELADQDRSVCAMEKMLFSELVGEKLHLSECRLDGGNCCTFEVA